MFFGPVKHHAKRIFRNPYLFIKGFGSTKKVVNFNGNAWENQSGGVRTTSTYVAYQYNVFTCILEVLHSSDDFFLFSRRHLCSTSPRFGVNLHHFGD